MEELWEMLDRIIDYQRAHGYAPTMRELCDLTGLASTNSVYRRLVAMEERGLIERTEYTARSIVVTSWGEWNLRQFQSRPWQQRETAL
jgi:repressor LexA